MLGEGVVSVYKCPSAISWCQFCVLLLTFHGRRVSLRRRGCYLRMVLHVLFVPSLVFEALLFRDPWRSTPADRCLHLRGLGGSAPWLMFCSEAQHSLLSIEAVSSAMEFHGVRFLRLLRLLLPMTSTSDRDCPVVAMSSVGASFRCGLGSVRATQLALDLRMMARAPRSVPRRSGLPQTSASDVGEFHGCQFCAR